MEVPSSDRRQDMNLWRQKLTVTCRVIANSLLPGATHKSQPRNTGPSEVTMENGRTVSPATFRAFLAAPERFADPCGEIRVIIPDSLPLAAPFILARLKRCGLSSCTVCTIPTGLEVYARR